MERRGLLNKHFCIKNQNIPNEIEKIVNFLFYHYKSMETISCHSNQSSYSIEIKNTTFRSPYLQMLYVKYEKIGLTASEEMSFENVDRRRTDGRTTDGRTTDTFIYYKLTNEPSAQIS